MVASADPKELVPILMQACPMCALSRSVTPRLTELQAQPNKVRLKGRDSERYEEKLLAKAKVISDSAGRLWRKCSSTPTLLKPFA